MELEFFNSYLNNYFLGQKFWVVDENDEIKQSYLISIEFNLSEPAYYVASNKYSLHKTRTAQLFNSREEAESFLEQRKAGFFIEA
jgi:hypothetical protein